MMELSCNWHPMQTWCDIFPSHWSVSALQLICWIWRKHSRMKKTWLSAPVLESMVNSENFQYRFRISNHDRHHITRVQALLTSTDYNLQNIIQESRLGQTLLATDGQLITVTVFAGLLALNCRYQIPDNHISLMYWSMPWKNIRTENDGTRRRQKETLHSARRTVLVLVQRQIAKMRFSSTMLALQVETTAEFITLNTKVQCAVLPVVLYLQTSAWKNMTCWLLNWCGSALIIFCATYILLFQPLNTRNIKVYWWIGFFFSSCANRFVSQLPQSLIS
jgi:hypothetical protein